jgi:hypothetical protein
MIPQNKEKGPGYDQGVAAERARIVAFGRTYAKEHVKAMGLWAQSDLLKFLEAVEHGAHEDLGLTPSARSESTP